MDKKQSHERMDGCCFRTKRRAERENFYRNLLGVIDVRHWRKYGALLSSGECGRAE